MQEITDNFIPDFLEQIHYWFAWATPGLKYIDNCKQENESE